MTSQLLSAFGNKMHIIDPYVFAGPAYDPGMMVYGGAGRYLRTHTASGNKITCAFRFNATDFSGSSTFRILIRNRISGNSRLHIYLLSNNYSAGGHDPSRMVFQCRSSSGTDLVKLQSNISVLDGNDQMAFFSYDGDTGNANYRINGIDADDPGFASRVAPITGTLANGSAEFSLGSDYTAGNEYVGDVGHFGIHNVYLTNWNDFASGSNPKEIDEIGWTEWGSRPEFWNEFGTMDDNEGTKANMIENGTITGPA